MSTLLPILFASLTLSFAPLEMEPYKYIEEPRIEIVHGEEVEINKYINESEIEILALVTMAEAEGESEEGRRLVIDTVLNRVDSPNFPNDIYSVVNQKYQFSSMWNGRAAYCRCNEIDPAIYDLIYEEVLDRTNYDVIYFTGGGYSEYGIPLFKVGNHYFSKEE